MLKKGDLCGWKDTPGLWFMVENLKIKCVKTTSGYPPETFMSDTFETLPDSEYYNYLITDIFREI